MFVLRTKLTNKFNWKKLFETKKVWQHDNKAKEILHKILRTKFVAIGKTFVRVCKKYYPINGWFFFVSLENTNKVLGHTENLCIFL